MKKKKVIRHITRQKINKRKNEKEKEIKQKVDQGTTAPRGTKISGRDRQKLYREAVRQLPARVPVNIILAPMEGDPMAASEFWQLAQVSGGSFLSPSKDWP